jgi:cell division transport system permease protein
MLARYFKRALEDILANRFVNAVTIVTILLAVVIVGAAELLHANAADLMNAWQQGTRILAYLRPEAKGGAAALKRAIESVEGVQQAVFISRDEALRDLKARMQHQASLFENLPENPLPDAFEIQLKPSSAGWEHIETVAARVRSLAEIEDVEYGRQWVDAVQGVAEFFRTVGMAMTGLFFVAAVAIVANTTRLVIYSRQEEVEIMRLVGASEGFIKTPFYIEGLLQGLAGALLGLGVLFVVFTALAARVEQSALGEMMALRFLALEPLAGITLASMVAGWLGCYVSLKEFMKI